MIAYDVLTHLWAEQHLELRHPSRSGQPALAAYEEKAVGARPGPHHELQHALWKELRRDGSPWLVTDLITLGSPLTHALLLMAENRADLARRKRSREFPVCPPEPDRGVDGAVSGKPFSFRPVRLAGRPRVLHHGALFGACRWTNLYFPAAAGLFGDPVGGPLANVFGPGICDGAVTRSSTARSPASHSLYWRADPKARSVDTAAALTALHDGETLDALTALRAALGLTCLTELRELAAAMPIERFVAPAATEVF